MTFSRRAGLSFLLYRDAIAVHFRCDLCMHTTHEGENDVCVCILSIQQSSEDNKEDEAESTERLEEKTLASMTAVTTATGNNVKVQDTAIVFNHSPFSHSKEYPMHFQICTSRILSSQSSLDHTYISGSLNALFPQIKPGLSSLRHFLARLFLCPSLWCHPKALTQKDNQTSNNGSKPFILRVLWNRFFFAFKSLFLTVHLHTLYTWSLFIE